MSSQVGLPFVARSETSKKAAESMILGSNAQRKRVYQWALTQRQGFTDEEAINALKMNPSSFRPRRGELVTGSLLRDSGRTRATQSGRQATVWEVF